MKTTIAIFIALFMASANATTESSSRKRTSAVYKSSSAAEDETFDPYLGMEHRKLHAGHSMSMSMSHSMSMSVPEVTARYVFCPRPHIHELFASLTPPYISPAPTIIRDYYIILTRWPLIFSQLLFDNSYPLPVPRPWVLLLQHVQRRELQCFFRESAVVCSPYFLVGFPWYLQFDTFGWMINAFLGEEVFNIHSYIPVRTGRSLWFSLLIYPSYPEFLFNGACIESIITNNR